MLTGVESKTQITPTKATPEKIQMSKEAEESLIENSTLVKRLRRELNEEKSNLNESNKKLAQQYLNGISAKKKILSEKTEKSDLLDENNLLDDTKF